MKPLLKRISIALFVGVLLNEIGAVIYNTIPSTRQIYADSSFIEKSYVSELAESLKESNLENQTNLKGIVTLPYFFYEVTPYLYLVVIFGAWIIREWTRERRFAKVLLLFFVFHVMQSFFYWYDRNTSIFCNLVLYLLIIVFLLQIAWPEKRPIGKYRSIKNQS